jgi:GTP-binding protein HflX
LIVHVVDATDPDVLGQIRTVHEVVAEVEASAIPELIVFNKADLVSEEDQIRLRGLVPGSLLVSARTGLGIAELETAIAASLPKPDIEFVGVVPYSRGDLVSRAHLAGRVVSTDYVEAGTKLHAFVKPDLAAELEEAKQS